MPLTARSRIVQSAVRLHRRRQRERENLFLAEGPDLVAAALVAGGSDAGLVRHLLVTPVGRERYEELVFAAETLDRVAVHELTEEAMRRACEAVSPQPIAAICMRRPVDPDVLMAGPTGRDGEIPVVALLVGCRDPGNLGTSVRLAGAVGARGVCVSNDSADPYSPKAARASAGALFDVPIAVDVDPAGIIALAGEAGFLTLATAASARTDLFAVGGRGLADSPNLWVFGGESAGLEPALQSACDRLVSIPMSGRMESLNLATAVALCLYESARTRGGPRQ